MLLVGALLGVCASFTTQTELSELLTQSTWISYEYWTDFNGDGNFVQTTQSCESDNQWSFSSDQTFSVIEYEQVCLSDLPELDTVSGVWGLDAQEDYLTLDLPAGATQLYFKIYSVGQGEIILDVIDLEDINAPTRERIILRR